MAWQRRGRKKAGFRLVGGFSTLLFLLGVAYLIHRPVLEVFHAYGSGQGGTADHSLLAGLSDNAQSEWRDGWHTGTTSSAIAAMSENKTTDLALDTAASNHSAATVAAAAAEQTVATLAAVSEEATASATPAAAVVKVEEPAPKGALPKHWTGNPEDYRLTPEAVAAIADEKKVIMVTWANFHYLDFVENWATHVQSAGVKNYIIGAMDDKLLKELAERGFCTFSMNSGLSHGDFGWGTKEFHKMGREKINLVLTFTKMGFTILVSDVDTVWMRDPLPYVEQYPAADVLVSSDSLAGARADGGLEFFPDSGYSAGNIGIMLVKPSALSFVQEWVNNIEANADLWDQNGFNELMTKGAKWPDEKERPDRLFPGYHGKLTFGVLPVVTFCNGHTFFVQRLHKKHNVEPYVVHATFQYFHTNGKRNRLRETLLWNMDPPVYYDRPGGFISYQNDVPAEMLARAVTPNEAGFDLNSTVPHFTLVHHQLLQMRSGLALAQALGRALVMPELWCGMDRWWAPHAGNIPGVKMPLPFQCPLDHVMDLDVMLMNRPQEVFGPAIEFRESSFLRNPKLPAAVNASRLQVVTSEAHDPTCAKGNAAAKEADGVVRLCPNLTDAQLKVALAPFLDRRVLHFSTMLNAFGGFADPGEAERFQLRLKEYASIWCCVNLPVGHVFYDMWFDKIPRVDRFNRAWDQPWHPINGP